MRKARDARSATADGRCERGFTIIEILVVVAIIGILAGAVALNVTGYIGKSRGERAKMDLSTLENAVELYYLEYQRYPSNDDGLEALAESTPAHPNGIIENVPTDPWGNRYEYRHPGQHGEFDIICYGRDGAPGGRGEDADIGNWELGAENQPDAPSSQ